MKYIIICICLLSIILVTSAISCHYNCQTCQIITPNTNISICIKCNNRNWGNLCQNECYCENACDIDTGDCIIMTKNLHTKADSTGYIFLFIIVLCAIYIALYKLVQYIQKRRQNKVHNII
jgi:cell division protein FtsL